MDKLVVLSGGMDSTTLLYFVKSRFPNDIIGTITFYYGQKHRKEIKIAKWTCYKLGVSNEVVDLGVLKDLAPSALTRPYIEIPKGHYEEESMKLTVVPNRNMVLLSLAISYAIGEGASFVYYGAHVGDHAIYPDCRPEFVRVIKEIGLLCDWKPIIVEAPFLDMTKIDILRLGLGLKVDYSLTWTCYEGGEKACGKCGSCVERLEAFEKLGVKDPLEYE